MVAVLLPVLATLLVLYIFYALHAVTDSYFVPACTVCNDWLHIPDDVAGATVLGAGLNAPELFGHAVALALGNPVGLGLIIGSFNFNILAIAGFTALFCPRDEVLEVEFRYVLRDVSAYVVSLGLLQWSALDGIIELSELILLLCTYILYVCVCVSTGAIARRCCSEERRPRSRRSRRTRASSVGHIRARGDLMTTAMSHGDLERAKQPLMKDAPGGADALVKTHPSDPAATPRVPSLRRISTSIASALHSLDADVLNQRPAQAPKEQGAPSLPQRALNVAVRPLHGFLRCIMPSDDAVSRGWFPLSMALCVCLLALLAYAMNCLCGFVSTAWHIPEELIGSTVVAVGTSLPNVVAAVAVGKKGKADMAICQAFGSNTFDILIAYTLPLFVKSVALGGAAFEVEASDLSLDVTLDLVVVAVYITLSYSYGGRLLPSFGALSLGLYAVWFIANTMAVYAAQR